MPPSLSSSSTPFEKLAKVSEAIMATSKRLQKMDLAGDFLSNLVADLIEFLDLVGEELLVDFDQDFDLVEFVSFAIDDNLVVRLCSFDADENVLNL